MTYCFAKVVKKFGKTKYSQEKRLNGVLSRTESNYNPYSNGIWIEPVQRSRIKFYCRLNPYSNGIRIEHLDPKYDFRGEGLNPYSNGIRIELLISAASLPLFYVLILILMEYG